MENKEDHQNILLVTTDSVRADYCSYLTRGRNTTPYLDSLVNESAVFTNAISPGPRTPSSMPVIFTGEHYRSTPTQEDFGSRYSRIADHMRRYETIAQLLSKQGYATAAYTANPWTTEATLFDQSVDCFRMIGSKHQQINDNLDGDRNINLYERLSHIGDQWLKKTDWFSQWPAFYEEIRSAINQLKEPWFIWVFLLDTHSPYIVPKKFRNEISGPAMYYSAIRHNYTIMRNGHHENPPNHLVSFLEQSYRDSIRSVDGFIEALEADVNYDNTTLIFHSDHGEAFGEHGTYGHQPELFEENIRVPFLIKGGVEPSWIDRPISLIELPKIIEYIVESRIISPNDFTDDFVVSKTEFGEETAVRGERWKYIQKRDGAKLFDLKNDPGEQIDLLDQEPEIAEKLQETHKRHERTRREKTKIGEKMREIAARI
ncbi:sulfatase-like hydrolase/transferase [Halegenticoccus tardaugens]|uniref:sulfatase-like hydrolase/transferase n=1 Tax=Halegenticoccus tardaugens TaxID=2071624 RepID=UPI00100AF4C4|nr:sulfatase-like hydrolase/transferase [Halegenticoccus tardaugens]